MAKTCLALPMAKTCLTKTKTNAEGGGRSAHEDNEADFVRGIDPVVHVLHLFQHRFEAGDEAAWELSFVRLPVLVCMQHRVLTIVEDVREQKEGSKRSCWGDLHWHAPLGVTSGITGAFFFKSRPTMSICSDRSWLDCVFVRWHSGYRCVFSARCLSTMPVAHQSPRGSAPRLQEPPTPKLRIWQPQPVRCLASQIPPVSDFASQSWREF